MRSSFFVLLLALGGCSGQEPTDNASNVVVKAPPPPTQMFGDTDLLKRVEVAGVEPSRWRLVLAPGDIHYTARPDVQPSPEPWYPVSPRVAASGATWSTHDSSGKVTQLTLTIAECRLHGDAWPLTATLEIAGRTLRGCARAMPPVL